MNKLFCSKELSGFVLLRHKLIGKMLKMSLPSTAILTLMVSVTLAANNAVDTVDPNFNVRVQTNSYNQKSVDMLNVQPDGRILASGSFNTYNGQLVGGLIRINADGSLDTTFNNNLLAPFSSVGTLVQNDGKIIIWGNFRLNEQDVPTASILRIDQNGNIDPSFNFALGNSPRHVAFDASGRIILSGSFQVMENGVTTSRSLIRLNADGSHDSTFKFQANRSLETMTTQNNKIIVGMLETANNQLQATVSRINDDGSTDSSFVPTIVGNVFFRDIAIQSDNKILALTDRKLVRINQNGGEDSGFQATTFPMQPKKILLTSDGKIMTVFGNSPGNYQLIRVLPNGVPDPSFNIYTYSITHVGGTAIQPDGSVLIGDVNPGFGTPLGGNGFIRVLPTGFADSSFNPGGAGFLNVNPGNIRALAVQSDDKILIGGKFDTVNGSLRNKIARLNADATLDNSFNVNTTATGNYFSVLNDIYTAGIQPDGKIVLTGNFNYFANGVQKFNMVRLNVDGSIDASFNFGINLSDYFGSSSGGQNRFAFQPDGKIFLGMSRGGSPGTTPAIRLNANGTIDNNFSATIYNDRNLVYIMDVAIQPDGKILIGGRYDTQAVGSTPGVQRSFLIRLNSNGSRDETFQVPDDEEKTIKVFKLQSDGKIIAAKEAFVSATARQTVVQRYNVDGSLDSSFNVGIGANGVINALIILPDGKIMFGGKFTAFNNQTRVNLAKLNADGSLDATVYTVNQEVLSLTLDNQQRLLVGGSFTTISVGDGQNVTRAYAARLITSLETTRTIFDFDGDGKSDVSVYRPESGVWHLQQSQSGYGAPQFGLATDKLVPADYDGDGKTDLAVFRENPNDPGKAKFFILNSSNNQLREEQLGSSGDIPVAGDWDGDGKADVSVYRSGTQSNPQGYFYYRPSSQPTVNFIPYPWGIAGDKPVVADYDGDGKADPAVFRPSTGGWFIQRSRDGFSAIQFGAAEDKPVAADYDGDGKADQAVFRPSNGVWYVWNSTAGFTAAQFGISTDRPVPADYDGDGKTDIAVYRDGGWFILNSTTGFTAFGFGTATDKPVPNVFVP